ncbi:MAG TPA: YqgE/AlgH family protein, partial [Gammaproteobacteria bacterium]|nr:YqgE/AlgH family protein [Gammaproteobacteria bacterium]
MSQDFLTNQFLVAMPSLEDPNFRESVTFICEHNARGALGIIINRPMNVVLDDILKQLDLTALDPA